MKTTIRIQSPENNELFTDLGLFRQLAGAFNDGNLDRLNGELHSLFGAPECRMAEQTTDK